MTTSHNIPYTPTTLPTPQARKSYNQIYQPPKQTPRISTSTDYFSTQSRKRQRPDSSHEDAAQQTPWTATPSWVQCPTPSDRMHMSSATVNEKYCLAGGFDTPEMLATSDYDHQQQEWCRRRVRDTDVAIDARDTAQDGGRSNTLHLRGPLARERNGMARMPSSPNGEHPTRGWASYAFQLVGQAFAFGSGVIRGFYAGGGKGYELDQPTLSDSWMHSRPPLQRQRRGSTPVPGSWQDEEFLGDFEQDNPNSPELDTTRPPNKRRQTDKDSWVLVGTPEVNVDLSRKRKSSISQRPSLLPRPAAASRANSRRSLLPVSRRQSSFVSQTGSPAHPPLSSHTALQEATQDRRASMAPTRSANNSRPSSSSGIAQNTYISPETARLLKRQAKQDKAADKAMNGMSRRLEDLIRQGQEALGTKISVEGGAADDMEMDEGFVDEEW